MRRVTTDDRASRNGAAGFVGAVVLAGVAAASVFAPGETARTGAAVAGGVGAVALLGSGRARLGAPDGWILALFGWAALSTYWADNPSASWDSMKDYAAFTVIFIAVRLAVSTRAQLRIVVYGYLAGCAIALWLLYAQNPPEIDSMTSDDRATIAGVNANYLAYSFVVGAVLLCTFWATRRPALIGRLVAIAFAIALFAVGIEGTGTRGAELGLILFVAWLLFTKVRPQTGLFVPAAFAVTASVAVAAGVLDGWFRSNLVASARETGTLNGRLDSWPLARHLFMESPIFGGGVDGFRVAAPTGTAAHNVVLDLGVGLGIFGLLLFAGVLSRALICETVGLGAVRGALVGGLMVAVAPIMASGYWYQAPALWVAVAVLSRLPVAYAERPEHDPTRVVLRGDSTVMARAVKRQTSSPVSSPRRR